MILGPAVLALLLATGLAAAALAGASLLGWKVARRWDPARPDETQLGLERRTHLVTTLLVWVTAVEAGSLVLLLYVLDDLRTLFTGAMCATGTLNAAGAAGWWGLAAKGAAAGGAALWLLLTGLDESIPTAPLTRRRYAALLALAPLAFLDFGLLVASLVNLDPDIITSCCGSLFSAEGSGVASELASLPPRASLIVLAAAAGTWLALALACLASFRPLLRYLLAGSSLVLLPVALAAVVSAVSVLWYQLPTHHCPFDLLQREYGFVGYGLYGGLLGAVLAGLACGLAAPLGSVPLYAAAVRRRERRWLAGGIAGILLFAGIVLWPILRGGMALFP